MSNKPSIGRITHFTAPGSGETHAAIVTKVNEDGTLNLTVFGPNFMSYLENGRSSPEAIEPAKGCWNWPPRA